MVVCLEREPQPLAQMGLALDRVDQVALRGTEGDQRPRLLLAGAGRPGRGERHPAHVGGAVGPHAHERVRQRAPAPLRGRRRRVLGQPGQRLLQLLDAAAALAQRAPGERPLVDDERRPLRVGVGVDQVEGLPQQGERALGIAAVERGPGGQPQDLHLVGAGPRLGVGHAAPDLERPFQVLAGLGGRERGDGLAPGTDRGGQGARHVVGGVPVHREGGRDRCVVTGQTRVAVQRLGVGGVQLGPLAREQVPVHGVAGERVAEGVPAPGAVDQQQRGVHRLAQRLVQLGGRDRRHLGEQSLGYPPAGDGGGAQQPLCRAGQPLRPRQQDVAQRGRQRVLAGAVAHGVQRVPRRRTRCPPTDRRPGPRSRRRGGSPRIAAICAAVSRRPNRSSCSRSTPRSRSQPDSSGRSGERRSTSSER